LEKPLFSFQKHTLTESLRLCIGRLNDHSAYTQWRTLILTDMGQIYYINTKHPPIIQSNSNKGNFGARGSET
jgi:hypothetical protein